MLHSFWIIDTGWLCVKMSGKFVPVCKLTEKQQRDVHITLRELGLLDSQPQNYAQSQPAVL